MNSIIQSLTAENGNRLCHFSKRANPYYVIFWGGGWAIGSLTLLIGVITAYQRNPASDKLIGVVFALIGCYVFPIMIYGHFRATYYIFVYEDHLAYYDIWLKKRTLHYTDIRKVIVYPRNQRRWFLYYGSKESLKWQRLDLMVDLTNKGLLIEQILSRSPNLIEVDIDCYLDKAFGGVSIWAKEPDWTIINTAKRRAEENKKKALIKKEEKQGT